MGDKKDIKPKQAIALEYDPSEEAPKVVASGRGLLAERIIEKAKEHQVPIHQDSKLADIQPLQWPLQRVSTATTTIPSSRLR